jgi:tetratricopeptide (TPR) repeat protein
MKWYKLAPLCGVLLLVAASVACNRLKARDQLNKGVAAFRNAQFQTAIMHFKNAVVLDPTLLNARLYLATSYYNMYVPGGESPDNLKVAQQAIDAYQDVLKMDANNTTALASIAQIYYYEKKFEEAKKYQLQVAKIDPNNHDPYYWIGVLDWYICMPRTLQTRRELGLDVPKGNDPNQLPPLPEKARAELEKQNGELVTEGLNMLQKALDLKPNDFDTMAYLNLMYRQKADLESDPSAREADLKAADDWTNKALASRKAAAAKAASVAH